MSRSEVVRAALADASPGRSVVEALCVASCRLLGAEHAAVCFATGNGPMVAEGSDPIAARLDSAQVLVGEGPLVSGLLADLPLLVGDLLEAVRRWPSMTETLANSPVEIGSLMVIPLRIGEARLGALSVYRSIAGDVEADRYADAVALGVMATEILLAERSGGDIPLPAAASIGSAIVQQAVGMLAERHRVGVLDAQVRLRAMAFGRGESIDELAGRIVRREDLEGEAW